MNEDEKLSEKIELRVNASKKPAASCRKTFWESVSEQATPRGEQPAHKSAAGPAGTSYWLALHHMQCPLRAIRRGPALLARSERILSSQLPS